MSYQIELDSQIFELSHQFFPNSLSENSVSIKRGGMSMDLKDIASDHFHLTWGNYRSSTEKVLTEKFDTSAITAFFQLSGPESNTLNNSYQSKKKELHVFRQEARTYEYEITATGKEQAATFFTFAIAPAFFENISTEESGALLSFYHDTCYKTHAEINGLASVTPSMLWIINEIRRNSYSGYMKELFLEAKAIELFLLLAQEMDKKQSTSSSSLKYRDIESLYEAKNYIEKTYNDPYSIIELARKVGINQTKLKNGFKELFGTTVFGYVKDIQMEKARQMLLDEELLVYEVSNRIGYEHPQHFTVAFKRKFGILPSNLKN